MAAKLKILGGMFKGMQLLSPPEGVTRPLQSIVKKSLFDSLGESVRGASCLDLFAGSGSIGLEALSRGAKACIFVESDRRVFNILQKNVDKISNYVDNGKVFIRTVQSRVEEYLDSGLDHQAPFDLVFLDPPFAAEAAAESCLNLLGFSDGWVTDAGIVVYQCRGEMSIKYPGWRLIDTRAFGDSTLIRLVRDTD